MCDANASFLAPRFGTLLSKDEFVALDSEEVIDAEVNHNLRELIVPLFRHRNSLPTTSSSRLRKDVLVIMFQEAVQ
jgi:hypothetical protein